jgi:vancomycin resistance protein YoaR
MKKFVASFLLGLAVAGGGLSIVAARHVEKIRPDTFVGLVEVGGLTHEEAAFKLRQWWETEKLRPIALKTKPDLKLEPMGPAHLGVRLDDAASVENLPLEDFWATIARGVAKQPSPRYDADPVLVPVEGKLEELAAKIDNKVGEPKPARAFLVKGEVKLEPEVVGMELDPVELQARATQAVLRREDSVDVPLKAAEKHVSDEALAQIKEVVTEFSTTFSSGNRARSSNIHLATSKFDGIVLMPGDTVSYNDTVGRRTEKNGFKIAGVYRNGRHDFDVGGGICQVSTTLYNAALFANLKIVKRQNHSMPVPYVPVGRDATVDYGNIDLVIENSFDHPIAISPEYKPGRITFRILGTKNDQLSVKVVTDEHKSWDTGLQTVVDKNLRPGQKKVVEKGSRGHSIKSYRLVYEGDKLVAKEPLGRSYYRGAKRIVAVGPSAVDSD